jgi:hypothetical protein
MDANAKTVTLAQALTPGQLKHMTTQLYLRVGNLRLLAHRNTSGIGYDLVMVERFESHIQFAQRTVAKLVAERQAEAAVRADLLRK